LLLLFLHYSTIRRLFKFTTRRQDDL
jgi:hypothetical protein